MSLVSTFAALGDPVRFAITERLMDRGALSAGDLQDVADISPPAISRHLKVLREAGIVTQSIDGTRRIYAINPAAIQGIDDWLGQHRDFWKAGLDRLAQMLEDDQ